ncbi:hypothetical protein ACFQ0X_20280 [Streptomyces rectiviolaceus]|uniref:NACHT N-terminal Helical domain 1-containing protein n=1 Tax=Streptomyces rectiviolaceus TaxID=332591 RepID=UPI00364544DE
MEPVVRIPSTLATPLVQRLIGTPPPQAPTAPELIAAFTTWRGPDAPATPDDVHRTAADLVNLAAETHAAPAAELTAVIEVLTRTLLAMGELDLTDVDAVRLGPQDYARRLRGAVQGADRALSPAPRRSTTNCSWPCACMSCTTSSDAPRTSSDTWPRGRAVSASSST